MSGEASVKKTPHAAEQDRPDVAAARTELKAEQSSLRAKRLVFIYEIPAGPNLLPDAQR
jgi:hypothetical protein